jgi:hypothetical protein
MDLILWEWFVTLSEFTRKQAESKLKAFCDRRIPAQLRKEVRLGWKFRGNAVTLFESRPSFPDRATWVNIPIAQFRFDEQEKTWELYQADRNGRWHWYINVVATPDFDALLAEVDADPTGIFWG